MTVVSLLWFHFFIMALAVYRVSHMLAYEDGPFAGLAKARRLTGVKTDAGGIQYGTNTFSTGIVCPYCNSVWLSILITIFYFGTSPVYTVMICFPFALSAAAILFMRFVDNG